MLIVIKLEEHHVTDLTPYLP